MEMLVVLEVYMVVLEAIGVQGNSKPNGLWSVLQQGMQLGDYSGD